MATVTVLGKGITSSQRMTNGDNEAAMASVATAVPALVRCTAAQSTTVARGGTKSMKLTPDGTAGSTYYYAFDSARAGAPLLWQWGARHVFSGYFYVPASSNVTSVLIYLRYNGTNYSTTVAVTPGMKDTWQFISVDAMVPISQSNTSWYPYILAAADSSVAANVIYWDDLSLMEYYGGGVSVPETALAGEGVQGVSGTVAVPMEAPEVSAAGQKGEGGTIAVELAAPEVSATGTKGEGGTIEVALPAPGVSAAGTMGVVGTIAAELPVPAVGVSAAGGCPWILDEEELIMYPILKGSTSVILTVEMRGVDGQPETGLAHGDVTCSYSREGEATGATVVALSAGAAGVYGSGHWCEADPANAAGLYQFGVPAAALATGARSVSFRFDAAGCFTRTVHVRLLAANLDDAVRMGLTGLPNATAGAEGGVPVLAASGLVVKSVTDAVTLTGAYDAAKTAASAANLAALQGDVTAIGVDVTALADVDVPAVKAVVDGLAVSLAALDAAVGALENVSVADVTAGILAGVVDSARTVAQILRRLDAYAGGNITRVDRATTYKREDGATTEMTHTIPVGALSRIVS